MSGPSYGLVLTQQQAPTLPALVTVADLAIQLKWEPPKEADASFLRSYVATVRAGVSLERPLTELRTWLRQQERGKS